MAALCTQLCRGWELPAAARLAVSAGTMQYYQAGARPLTQDELEALHGLGFQDDADGLAAAESS